MSLLSGPFQGVDRQGYAFLIVKLGDLGKVPLCAYWTSRPEVRSSLLGDGWCLPLLESRVVPSERSGIDFFQPDGFVRTLVRGRKDAQFLFSGLWRGREEGEGNVLLSADFGVSGGKVDMGFRGGRLSSLKCAEGAFAFTYKGREPAKVMCDGGTALTVTRDPRNENRVEFRFSGRTSAVCERRDDGLTIVAADGTRHVYALGKDDNGPFLKADDVLCRWDFYTGRLTAFGDWTYQVDEPKPDWNNAAISRTHADGRTESYWFNSANGKGTYRTADGDFYEWERFPAGSFYGLLRWSKKTHGGELAYSHRYTYDERRRKVYHLLCRGAAERQGGRLPAKEETWFAPDGKVKRRRLDGVEVKP